MSHIQQAVVHIHSHVNSASSSPHLHLPLSFDLYQVTCISRQPCRSMFDATWHQGQSVPYKCPSRLVPVKIRLRRRFSVFLSSGHVTSEKKKKKTLCHGMSGESNFTLYNQISLKLQLRSKPPTPNPNPHLHGRWPHRQHISW